MKKLWKKFEELSGKCYSNMIGAYEDFNVWNETFEVLLDIINDEREKNPEYASEFIDLDDSTDFAYDVSSWMEDYLDELDMRKEYDRILKVCEKLILLFRWEEESPSDLRTYISTALAGQGKYKESLEFCEEWYRKEGNNLCAVTALIYARMRMKALDEAEELVKKYISENTECNEDNDIIFTAAAALYKVKGDKRAEKRMNQAIRKYEKELEEYFLNMEDEEDMDFDMLDEELPFY